MKKHIMLSASFICSMNNCSVWNDELVSTSRLHADLNWFKKKKKRLFWKMDCHGIRNDKGAFFPPWQRQMRG